MKGIKKQMKQLHYRIGTSGQTLVFSPSVLDHFYMNRQNRFWHRESGGLLFAKLSPNIVDVSSVTGPRPTDRRSRWRYFPDRRAEQDEIDFFHPLGQHFVGFWHTHPEDRPAPSRIDEESLSESVRLSDHQLNGFVQVIVGRNNFPEGLFVGVGDGSTIYPLTPEAE